MSKHPRVRITRTDPDNAVIDLTGLSFGDNIRMTRIMAKLGKVDILQMKIDALKAQGQEPDLETIDELLDLMNPATMDEMFNDSCASMAAVVVSVPADWWVQGAPENLDLKDAESYKYLRADKARHLQNMIREARKVEEVSKN